MIPIATNDDLKATLDERGVQYDDNATNAELAALVRDNPAPSGDDTNDGGENGDPRAGGLPSESLEQGAAASSFEPNDDAPEGSIAQVERLPDE